MRMTSGGVQRIRHLGRGGFTLAEALVASMVVAIVAAAATLPILAAQQQQQQSERLRAAVEAGRSLLDEVIARPMVDPDVPDTVIGPSGIETARANFQTVDAFGGYSETDGVIRDFRGDPLGLPLYNGLWRTVSAEYVTFPGQPVSDTTGLLRVTVDVYDGQIRLARFTRLVAKEG